MKKIVEVLSISRQVLAILIICAMVLAGTQFMLILVMNLLGIQVPDFIAG